MENLRPMRWVGLLLSMLVLLALACNLGGSQTATQPAGGGEEEGAPSGRRPGAVSSLADVKLATIQIEAQGSFVSPEFGLVLNQSGLGSGFIIDPSGLAITNNHVVAGAALLKVWIGDEIDSRNARILGVSECSDLAVIDIEGDGFPYLEWYQGNITVGLPISVAGFPLGDPEFTLLEGTVSKERAGGESSWSSVDYVIEHTALTNPGLSGGPVVTQDGGVVAVHYAGNPNTEQHWAISRDEALPVIERLRQGENVDSIGVNGTAVISEDGSLSGIWVSSVESGSPADGAGITGGDIITSMEGLVLATDGTMADYCDILRTKGQESTLAVEVLRYQQNQYLTGQLNGRALEVAGVLGQELGGQVEDTGDSYTEYVQVTDDYGAIVMEVPASWTDVDGSPWVDSGETIGASIWAAPDLDGFVNTWGTPGVKFDVSDDLAKLGGYIQVLDFYRENTYVTECELDGRYDYNDGYYRGRFDYFVKCGGSGGPDYLILSAVPVDSSLQMIIVVQVQILSEADLDAADRILASFDVVGQLP